MFIDRRRVEAALPGYEVSTVIGRGGFGVVIAARHRQLDRPVAVKVLVPDTDEPHARGRFLAEARVLAQLDHPHIVRIHDYVERDELCLLVMERLDSGSLRAKAARGLTVDVVAAVGLTIAAALEHAHTQQVLHRDIKPDNVLFTARGVAKVADFGIAKILEGASARASTLVGTPVYMAPEQIEHGRLGPASDIYALGVVLYELLSGRTPFPPNLPLVELMRHHLYVPPPPLTSTPPALAAVVSRTLHKDREARPPSAHAFALDLAAATADTLGPDWLLRCRLPVHLADDVRDAARTPTRPTGTTQPPTPPVPRAATHTPTATPEPGHARPDPPASPPSVERDSAAPPPRPRPSPGPDTSKAPAGRRSPLRRRTRPGRRTEAQVPLRVKYPTSLAVAADGSLLVSQPVEHRVVRITPAGDRHVVAGTGKAGFSGDGGPAADAELDNPCGIALDRHGTLFIADCFNNRVRRVADGTIGTCAGSGRSGPAIRPGAASAPGDTPLDRPRAVAVDDAGRLYVASTDAHQILGIDTGGTAVLAGVGTPGYSGDRGPAPLASLNRPHHLAIGPGGVLAVADTHNRCIRRIDPAGTITTVAGGHYGPHATAAGRAGPGSIGRPYALAFGPGGALIVADPDNHRILRVTSLGAVGIVAGSGRAGSSGDGGPATAATLDSPRGLAVDPDGAVYVADTGSHRIRRIDTDGTINAYPG